MDTWITASAGRRNRAPAATLRVQRGFSLKIVALATGLAALAVIDLFTPHEWDADPALGGATLVSASPIGIRSPSSGPASIAPRPGAAPAHAGSGGAVVTGRDERPPSASPDGYYLPAQVANQATTLDGNVPTYEHD